MSLFDFSIFIKTFWMVFLVVSSVGPAFITTANLSMTYGYKKGFIGILGCWTIDILYVSIGALALKAVANIVSKDIMTMMSLFASFFLIYIAYGFWKTDISKIKSQTTKKDNVKIYLKMLCLAASSPLAILGYGAIFSSFISADNNLLSVLLGGYLGTIISHSCIVLFFATLGKKIKDKFLVILNKVSAGIITCFAIGLIINFIKTFIIK